MGFEVDDIEAAVRDLRERGVVFEKYERARADGRSTESPRSRATTRARAASGERAAWFRDSEGNLLGMGQRLAPVL